MIAFAMCGSFCTHSKSIEVLKSLKCEFGDTLPILSTNAATSDTRFGKASMLCELMHGICGKPPIVTLTEAEPIGPRLAPELMIIAPCTGNTLAKLAVGISDTPVTLAAKSHLRNDRPLLIGLATNDGLSRSLSNIAALYSRKHIYFVPMCEDDPKNKPNSLVCDFDRIVEAARAALSGKQLLPLFYGK